jgi:hypothetical protein
VTPLEEAARFPRATTALVALKGFTLTNIQPRNTSRAGGVIPTRSS